MAKGRRKDDPSSLNVIASFDIETSSFYERDDGVCVQVDHYANLPKSEQARYEKRACLCAWGFGLNGRVLFGRTWEEFMALLDYVRKRYSLGPDKLILPVYIHNESYEWQWFRRRLKWVRVFAVQDRYPIRALCDMGFEFRDSLIVSGMSLKSTAKGLLKYKVDKLSGDWDYALLRGSKTKIEPKEWGYLENDNLVVMAYMQELLESYGNVNRIPMTKTGFVREDVRAHCYWDGKSHLHVKTRKFSDYRRLMDCLKLDGMREFSLLNQAFMGGFTHANALNANMIHRDVTSYDISSSYPAVICSEKFPMGRGFVKTPKNVRELRELMKTYCCVMDISFFDVDELFQFDHVISESKCVELEGAEVDNGRVIRAKRLRISITEIDFECFERFYVWRSVKVHLMYCYHRNYLPKPIIEKVLEYYEGKTTLKGVEGMEAEYARLKTLINSIFGCMVTNPCKENLVYEDDGWSLEDVGMEALIERYNESKSRFLFYPWGVYITAYARRNIMSAILSCGSDHIYTDTDSEKILHAERHQAFFEGYNALITRKIRLCLSYHNLPLSRAFPKTNKGVVKPLGYFEVDGVYSRFSTLGAKRYAVDYGKPENANEPWTRYSLTVSGVNKNTAIPAIYKRMVKEKRDFFDYFKFGTLFDREMCGKKLHTYIDEETRGVLIDKDGKRNPYHELSSVHLEETTYLMTGSDEYLSLLDNLQSIAYID